MEDVIFNGTAQRKPVGFAEVSLVIDNRSRKLDFDADDVKVTRRYYRSGESEYLINNATVRLKDVQMLFMDTGLGRDGYSIIGQGRIGDIVASSRRAAGNLRGGGGHLQIPLPQKRGGTAAEIHRGKPAASAGHFTGAGGAGGPAGPAGGKGQEIPGIRRGEKGSGNRLVAAHHDRFPGGAAGAVGQAGAGRTQYEAAGEAMDGFEAQMEDIARQAQELAVEVDNIPPGRPAAGGGGRRCDGDVAVLRNDIYHNKENTARIEEEIRLSAEGDSRIEEDIAARQADIRGKREAIAPGRRRSSWPCPARWRVSRRAATCIRAGSTSCPGRRQPWPCGCRISGSNR